MSMEIHGGMILTRETEDLGEKPVLVPLYPPQIARGMNRVSTNRAYMDSAVTDS
jgi:hypothetical protein